MQHRVVFAFALVTARPDAALVESMSTVQTVVAHAFLFAELISLVYCHIFENLAFSDKMSLFTYFTDLWFRCWLFR